ncbi:MAG: SDR family NAD(P)-dependent oxidoreductase [Coriobacteriales bacterium]|jgi:NAD(P)-dependent dehydrogenase (short-subunit alcohol dehydrogenase family)
MSKVQIVTGGTSGMGLATAEKVAKYGPVVIVGRNEKRMENALGKLRAAGVDAHGVPADVSDRASLSNVVEGAQKIGEVQNVVHAAAVAGEKDTDAIIKIDVMGTINVVETFLPFMKEGCAMALYSSTTGRMFQPSAEQLEVWAKPNDPDFVKKFKETLPDSLGVDKGEAARLPKGYIAYFAAKNFVMYYTRANAARFGARGARIFSIAPGSFATPMLNPDPEFRKMTSAQTALGRIGDPDEMASLFAALLDPSVGYLTGTDVLMDGGMFAKQFTPQLP